MNAAAVDDPFGSGEDEDAPQDEKTQAPRGGSVVAGKRPSFPPAKPLPPWRSAAPQDAGDGVDEEIGYGDLDSVNQDLVRLRVRLNRVRRSLRAASREAVEAKLTYQRALRRALIQQSGGTAEMRRATAELMCEELEADMVMKQQVADEYSSLFRSVRDDIDNAKTVAYNLRTLANII